MYNKNKDTQLYYQCGHAISSGESDTPVEIFHPAVYVANIPRLSHFFANASPRQTGERTKQPPYAQGRVSPTSQPAPIEWVHFGDFSTNTTNAKVYAGDCLQALKNIVLKHSRHQRPINFVIHNGDIAYNLNWENGCVGDRFLRDIEPIASYVPYLTIPGDHEIVNKRMYHQRASYSHYLHRFNGVSYLSRANRSPFFFFCATFSLMNVCICDFCDTGHGVGAIYVVLNSFNYGNIHFIMLHSDPFLFAMVGSYQMESDLTEEWDWLIRDLRDVDRRGIIYDWGCIVEVEGLRGLRHGRNLEQLLHDFGVGGLRHATNLSLILTHVSLYALTQRNYDNPLSTVHVTNGNAGTMNNADTLSWLKPHFTAHRIDGSDQTSVHFAHLIVHNDTRLTYNVWDKHNRLLDTFDIYQSAHGPFTNHPLYVEQRLWIPFWMRSNLAILVASFLSLLALFCFYSMLCVELNFVNCASENGSKNIDIITYIRTFYQFTIVTINIDLSHLHGINCKSNGHYLF
ncbi:hypothetical protein RFI_06810 [Reticulomyxa filosa]|uniref:Calcineurin-like phosphoesterase domain-containing protein n=1 Tax=Reticulomyxa filosa TaxID=46433 RepID=X6NWF5_RETFI|nr:hypothetical protein RFI_06810 [Reticulomyxa filosa]|eukprot:ETO30311.1 hypothetical protein RFI_06810 [Reticulomyxa filosa]